MKLTITIEGSERILSIELPADFTIEDFLAYIESETQIKPESQVLKFNGTILSKDAKTLGDWKLEEDSLLVLGKKVVNPVASSNNEQPVMPIVDTPYLRRQIEMVRQQFLQNPASQARMDPVLKGSVNDEGLFREKMMESMRLRQREESRKKKEYQQLMNNPDSPESQRRIMELINQQAIDENMQTALEETPESFTRVHMLYINCEVNDVPVKAFVDTGAQMTILSPELAEKCGLSRLIDKRFEGEARGVGSAQIEGRIHSAPLKISGQFFPCSFIVVPSPQVQMLLGLDMLRRFQATIDLKSNKLVIGNVETKFLPEAECPKEFGDGGKSGGSRLGTNLFDSSSGFPVKKPKTNNKPINLQPRVVADQQKVQQLVDMGFDRRQAEQALIQTNNNLELAAGMLFD